MSSNFVPFKKENKRREIKRVKHNKEEDDSLYWTVNPKLQSYCEPVIQFQSGNPKKLTRLVKTLQSRTSLNILDFKKQKFKTYMNIST